MDSLHHSSFLALNAGEAAPHLLVLLAIVCAKYLYYLVPLHIAVVWFAGTRDMRFVAIVGALALAGALLVSGMIGFLYPTPRPFLIGLGRTLIEHRPSASFPSNHAIVCFCWAAVLAIYGHGRLALATTAIGLLVAWSRIYLGVHFPIDMVGAALLATVVAVLAVRLTLRDDGRLVHGMDALARRLLPRKLARARAIGLD